MVAFSSHQHQTPSQLQTQTWREKNAEGKTVTKRGSEKREGESSRMTEELSAGWRLFVFKVTITRRNKSDYCWFLNMAQLLKVCPFQCKRLGFRYTHHYHNGRTGEEDTTTTTTYSRGKREKENRPKEKGKMWNQNNPKEEEENVCVRFNVQK